MASKFWEDGPDGVLLNSAKVYVASTYASSPTLTITEPLTGYWKDPPPKISLSGWMEAAQVKTSYTVAPPHTPEPLHTPEPEVVAPPPLPAPAPPPEPADDAPYTLAGVQVTAGQIRAAIALLDAAPGNSVTVPLAKADHPLTGVNWLGPMARERAWTRPPDKIATKRTTVVRLLRRLIDPLAAGPLRRDAATGYLLPVTPEPTLATGNADAREQLRGIAAAVGNGRVVGRPLSAMNHDQIHRWLECWFAGDLAGCYRIEAAIGHASPHHPGHPQRPDTHRIVWAPAVPGEVPAGVTLPGDWPSPQALDSAVISAYLALARHANPRHLSSLERRRWVRAHLAGEKCDADYLSLTAASRAAAGAAPRSPQPTWIQPPTHNPDWQHWAKLTVGADAWPMAVLRSYVAAHELDVSVLWKHQVAVVATHQERVRREVMLDAVRMQLRRDPHQPTLTGYHRKALVIDQVNRRWLFKAAPDGHRFRADTEHAAHELARAWGYGTAESHLATFEDQYGQLQALLPVHRNLLGFTGAAFASLTLAQLCAIAREHILDWAVDNDDTHGENIVLCTDGAVIGIDKGRAWRYFGGWQGLTADQRANTNAQLVYTALYDAIAEHVFDQDTVAAIYHSVAGQARRMQQLPDDTVARWVLDGVEHRPHYQPSSYQTPIDGAPANAEELVNAAVRRKNQLAADMDLLWTRIYQRAGWTKPDPDPGALPDNPQGHPLHAGLHSPDLHAAVLATKSYGSAAFVAGRDVEDAHVLLWRERGPNGTYHIRGHLKVRGAAKTVVDQWCLSRARNSTATPAPELPSEASYYAVLIAAAKTVSHHHADKEYNPDKVRALDLLRSVLTGVIKRFSAEDSLDHRGVAMLDMATLYLGYIERIDTHRAKSTKSQEGDFPRYVYTPPPTPEPPAGPVAVALVPAARPAAHLECTPRLTPDGELGLDGSNLQNRAWGASCMGQFGDMYRMKLPTGEIVEYRTEQTSTPMAMCGQLQFTIPDAARIASGLSAVQAHLAEMGLVLRPAEAVDLELFYWRHLAGVMAQRCDAHQQTDREPYQAFWAAVKTPDTDDRDTAVGMWRDAFAQLVGAQRVEEFRAQGLHLPRFMHFDARHPTQPGGHPYWMRIDVTDEQWRTRKMPSMVYRTGPQGVLSTGMAASTEARVRHFAIWKTGMSSAEDMGFGSSAFIFTRQNFDDSRCPATLYLSPRVLARTHNYAFSDDKYGRAGERRQSAPFDFKTMTGFGQDGNELLIKNAVSLLDDIEIVVFANAMDRDTAVVRLQTMGITQIRGVPVHIRFVVYDDEAALRTAKTAARVSYHQDWQAMAAR